MQAADQVLTVRQMRAAEQALIDGGESVSSLMDRAGRGAADWVWRMAAGRSATVLCGPGNNGGDGYVIARVLAERGLAVQVVAPLEPKTEAAVAARATYLGGYAEDAHGGVLVDCLFGSGLARPLGERLAGLLCDLAMNHDYLIAVDVPSGVDSDSGRLLDEGLPHADLTLALGAWKFAHWTMPAAAMMGVRKLVDIGCESVSGAAFVLGKPKLWAPAVDDHKYSRGLLAVVAGEMPGAAVLACEAAQHAGAGYVKLLGDAKRVPLDVVRDARDLPEALADDRIAAILVGPGLGRDEMAKARVAAVLERGLPAVVDADALRLLGKTGDDFVLTPHHGELAALCRTFGIEAEGHRQQVAALAVATGAVVVAKGPDTMIAAPDGRLAIAPPAPSWLSTAGTGDVLAGIVASRLATGEPPFEAACQGVWLHGEAARLAGPAFTAGELAGKVAAAYAACL